MMSIKRVHAPVRQQTLDLLRKSILSGEFKPGERLTESKLCKLTNVSRTSIREALRALEQEDLIEMIPNKGPIVACLTAAQAEDIYQVRELLEPLACRLFSERATANEMSKLGEAMNLIETAAQSGDIKNLIEENARFYDILLRGCRNKVVSKLIRSLLARIIVLRFTTLSQPGRPLQSVDEMKSIVAFIQNRDGDGAWKSCVDHILRAKAVALPIVRVGQSNTDKDLAESRTILQAALQGGR